MIVFETRTVSVVMSITYYYKFLLRLVHKLDRDGKHWRFFGHKSSHCRCDQRVAHGSVTPACGGIRVASGGATSPSTGLRWARLLSAAHARKRLSRRQRAQKGQRSACSVRLPVAGDYTVGYGASIGELLRKASLICVSG